tara:strand:+ start:556 stop:1062 length:507 start_codon:yes stop_codon:yes gene_type:complete
MSNSKFDDTLLTHLNTDFDIGPTLAPSKKTWAYTRSRQDGTLVEICAGAEKFMAEKGLSWEDVNMKTLEHYELLNAIDGLYEMRDEMKRRFKAIRERVIRTRQTETVIHTINEQDQKLTTLLVTSMDKTNCVVQIWKVFNADNPIETMRNFFMFKKSTRSNVVPFRPK